MRFSDFRASFKAIRNDSFSPKILDCQTFVSSRSIRRLAAALGRPAETVQREGLVPFNKFIIDLLNVQFG